MQKSKVTQNIITMQPQEAQHMLTMNVIENAMLIYCRKNNIKNAYQFFSNQCGYKEKNYFYHLFSQRAHYKLGLEDIKTIYSITKDKAILSAMMTEVQDV